MQFTLFTGSTEFKIVKPIRLIELFAGYGSQHLALKYLGLDVKSYKICEWAVKSIQAYKDIHFKDDNTDYSQPFDYETIINKLENYGISANYNDPMTREQIKRMGELKCRQVFNNIKATHNLVNISTTKGEDLHIYDTEHFDYIMTYSFPCQDLSKAGQGKGMAKDSGTRSGLLWQVERILEECNELGCMPQVLLMENVPDVIGTNNIKHFAKWIEKLEQLGYKNYWQVLNAKDYGIPQNRERCFMVSLLGDYYYEFPEKIKLEHKLKDLLEDEVDEKFYLSGKMKDYCLDLNGTTKGTKWQSSIENATINKEIAMIIGCRSAESQRAGITNFVVDNCDKEIKVSDLKTQLCNELIRNGKVQENDVIRHILDFYNQTTKANISGTITTRVDASNSCAVYNNLRIRKLTPKECFRLMGVKDKDFELVAENQSNASLYHLAGDSIVVNVLMEIFKNLL